MHALNIEGLRRGLILIFLTVALAIAAAGCGADKDADPGQRDLGSAKARINMPDNFPTVALKCRGTTGIYVTNSAEASSGGLFVLPNDPECGGDTQ